MNFARWSEEDGVETEARQVRRIPERFLPSQENAYKSKRKDPVPKVVVLPPKPTSKPVTIPAMREKPVPFTMQSRPMQGTVRSVTTTSGVQHESKMGDEVAARLQSEIASLTTQLIKAEEALDKQRAKSEMERSLLTQTLDEKKVQHQIEIDNIAATASVLEKKTSQLNLEIKILTDSRDELRSELERERSARCAAEAALSSSGRDHSESENLNREIKSLQNLLRQREAEASQALLEAERARLDFERVQALLKVTSQEVTELRTEKHNILELLKQERDKVALQRAYMLKRDGPF